MSDKLREGRVIYTDAEGNECDLSEMCRRVPEWAAERLTVLSKQLAAMTIERDAARTTALDLRRMLDNLAMYAVALAAGDKGETP